MKKNFILAMAMIVGSSAVMLASGLTASQPQKFATSPNGFMAPVWSPDGSKIAAAGPNYTGIYVFEADGSHARQLTDAQGAGYKMAWSENGAEVIGRTNVREGMRVLHEIKAWNVATGKNRVVAQKARTNATPGSFKSTNSIYKTMVEQAGDATATIPALARFKGQVVINPALSPDGSKIAFQIPGRCMWLVNADGSCLKELGKGSHPVWMPDSKTIIFTVVEDDGNNFTASTVFSMDINSQKAEVLVASNNLIPLTPAVSPDGSKMIFENAKDASLYIVNLKK